MRFRFGIRWKILLPALVVYVLGIGAVIFTARLTASSVLEKNILSEGDAMARDYAARLRIDLNLAMDAARTVGKSFEGLHASGLRDARAYDALLKTVLEGYPAFSATWTIWEPSALGDDPARRDAALKTESGRFAASWARTEGGALQRSQVKEADAQGAFYTLPLQSGREVLIEPYPFSYTGKKEDEIPMTSLAVPIRSEGKTIGVAGVDLPLGTMRKVIGSWEPVDGAYVILVDNGAKRIQHPKAELLGKPVGDDTPEHTAPLRKAIAEGKPYALIKKNLATGAESYLSYAPVIVGADTNPWSLALVLPLDSLMAPLTRLFYVLLGLGALGLAVGVPVLILVASSIARPVAVARENILRFSEGDFRSSSDHWARMEAMESRSDELGDMARAMVMLSKAVGARASEIQSAARQVSTGADQASSTAQALSSGASQQAASGEEVSASMEEMGSSVKQNSDNAQATESIARRAADSAAEGGVVVSEAVEAMREIARRIGIIEEIARQTNLLALNAAIEAARAGESGKGFAVVASEVRKLAERSQKAAQEITELSRGSVSKAERAGELIAHIVPDIRKTSELVMEIAAASREQSSGVDQVNKALTQLDEVIQQNASASEELASMSEELSAQGRLVLDSLAFFRVDGGESGKTVSQAKPQRGPAAKPAQRALAKAPEQRPALPAKTEKTLPSVSARTVDDADFEEF